MRSHSFIVWLVILGLLFSLKGRVEPELAADGTSNGLGVMSVAEKNREAFPISQPRPLGDHKDLHGCIHVHAPCVLSAGGLPFELSFFLFTMALSSPTLSLLPITIPHPPRV